MKKLISVLIILVMIFVCGCESLNNNSQTDVNKKDTSYKSESNKTTKRNKKKNKKEEKVTVVDAIKYEQPIAVDPEFHFDLNELTESARTNTYIAPKITLNTKNATLFNGKLLGQNNWYYENMKDKYAHYSIKCDYDYKIYNNDLISIILFSVMARQKSGYNTQYFALYYSVSEDRELTFEEYLEKMNLTIDELNENAKTSSDYQNAYGITSDSKITATMLDDESSYVIYDGTWAMEGWTAVKFGSILD